MKLIKIVIIILFFVIILIAQDKVFFDENTPFLDKIYNVLKKNNYILTKDSANANYYGEITTKNKKDSTQCMVMIKNEYEKNIIGSFSMELIKKTEVKKNVKKYAFFGFLLNSLMIILYFIRST
ncbi:MAG: hypothetical protein U9R41_02010 [Candidatus Marinimicrobia bacterium]|nr:hypothetical protein [Candidatus Neomarinimicrobiota bacterium]